MPTTLAIRFPLGRYHATAWDRSVNEGAVEWPPSPWRLLRALTATWHARWPGLPASALDDLLGCLADPPSYRTPHAWPAHTGHYLPGAGHRTGDRGGTDLALDPFLRVQPGGELLVRWDADLTGDQRAVLSGLAGLLPYLGRSESVCEARLLDADQEPGELGPAWWRPRAVGTQQTRLLAPAGPVSRHSLELSPLEFRRGRRTVPPGTAWVPYARTPETDCRPQHQSHGSTVLVEAIRLCVTGRVPLQATRGILLADDVHAQAGRLLAQAQVPDQRRQQILGTGGAAGGHRHAHWIPLAGDGRDAGHVCSLVIWVPGGLDPGETDALERLRSAPGKRAAQDGQVVRGFPDVELLFQAAGPIRQVAPELSGSARRWRSVTPYLPVRHRKNEPLDGYVSADVRRELRNRRLPPARVCRADPAGGLPDESARPYRRYRIRENFSHSRPGLGLNLEFCDDIDGPILIGQLNHFGYGIFGAVSPM